MRTLQLNRRRRFERRTEFITKIVDFIRAKMALQQIRDQANDPTQHSY